MLIGKLITEDLKSFIPNLIKILLNWSSKTIDIIPIKI